jgi:4a-hydroxytetrahydrobiopterin dehydratase
MTDYTEMKCEACRAGAPPATTDELSAFFRDHPEWERIEENGVPQIRRVFAFKNFVSALDFTNRVGELAEVEGHHPALLTEWGKVTVRWWTHKIHGLHRNDLIAGAKTDTRLTYLKP